MCHLCVPYVGFLPHRLCFSLMPSLRQAQDLFVFSKKNLLGPWARVSDVNSMEVCEWERGCFHPRAHSDHFSQGTHKTFSCPRSSFLSNWWVSLCLSHLFSPRSFSFSFGPLPQLQLLILINVKSFPPFARKLVPAPHLLLPHSWVNVTSQQSHISSVKKKKSSNQLQRRHNFIHVVMPKQ